jgi:hypothetical protein
VLASPRQVEQVKKERTVLSSLRRLDSSASTEGLPSVSDSHTIASLADATAANLTALAQHSPGQLDHVANQGFTLGPSNLLPNIGSVGSFGPKPTYCH